MKTSRGHFAGRFTIPAINRRDAENIAGAMLNTCSTDTIRRDAEVCVVIHTRSVRLIMPVNEVAQFSDDLVKFYREMVQPSSVKPKLSLRSEAEFVPGSTMKV